MVGSGAVIAPVKNQPLVEIFTDTTHIEQAKSFPRPELSPYGVRVPVPPGLGAGKATPQSLKPPNVVDPRAQHVAPAMGVPAVGAKRPRDRPGAHVGQLDQRVGP